MRSNKNVISEEVNDKLSESQKNISQYLRFHIPKELINKKITYQYNIYYTVGNKININDKHPIEKITEEEIKKVFPTNDTKLKLFKTEEHAINYALSDISKSEEANLSIPIVFKIRFNEDIKNVDFQSETVKINLDVDSNTLVREEKIEFATVSNANMELLSGLLCKSVCKLDKLSYEWYSFILETELTESYKFRAW